MGTYRKEWGCCGSVTETQAWEPEDCPFCTPDQAAHAGAAILDGLQRYQFDGNENDDGALEPWSDGEWVRYDDVRAAAAASQPQKGSEA